MIQRGKQVSQLNLECRPHGTEQHQAEELELAHIWEARSAESPSSVNGDTDILLKASCPVPLPLLQFVM